MRYSFLLLVVESTGVRAESTDANILEWVNEETLRLAPGANKRYEVRDLEDQLCKVQMARLGGKDKEVAWVLLRKLCDLGWKPRAVSMSPDIGGGSASFER